METMFDNFHSFGGQPTLGKILNMWVRGAEMEETIALSMWEEIRSSPEAVTEGRLYIWQRTWSSEYRKSWGYELLMEGE